MLKRCRASVGIFPGIKKTPFYNEDLYKHEPYALILLSGKINLKNVPVQITSISENEYQIDVESNTGNQTFPVKFTQRGKFGEPFENSYFGFILDKVNGQFIPGNEIHFIIHNLDNLASTYQKKLKVISNENKPDLMELLLSENNPDRGVDFLNRLEQTYIDFGLAEKKQCGRKYDQIY